MAPGQVYYVRRHVNDMFTPAGPDFTPVSIHTAGWITILDVKEDMAVAEVTHACDGIMEGDYLEPYVEPVIPGPATDGAPDYDHPVRIVMADEGRQTGTSGSMMLLNQGSDAGLRAGQTMTIFRTMQGGDAPVLDVGRATILSVRPKTALVRIDSSHDAVYIGDLGAVHRITQ